MESSPYYERAKRYMPRGAGSVLAFGIAGGSKHGQRFVESLTLHSHVANIGDVRTLAIHPASTTHGQLTPEEQLSTGTAPNMVRLSVGIETVNSTGGCDRSAMMAGCSSQHPTRWRFTVWHNDSASRSAPASRP